MWENADQNTPNTDTFHAVVAGYRSLNYIPSNWLFECRKIAIILKATMFESCSKLSTHLKPSAKKCCRLFYFLERLLKNAFFLTNTFLFHKLQVIIFVNVHNINKRQQKVLKRFRVQQWSTLGKSYFVIFGISIISNINISFAKNLII